MRPGRGALEEQDRGGRSQTGHKGRQPELPVERRGGHQRDRRQRDSAGSKPAADGERRYPRVIGNHLAQGCALRQPKHRIGGRDRHQ